MCSLLLFAVAVVFLVGFFIGYSAFSTSPKRMKLAILSGVTALVVTVGIVFAGCLVLLENTTFH